MQGRPRDASCSSVVTGLSATAPDRCSACIYATAKLINLLHRLTNATNCHISRARLNDARALGVRHVLDSRAMTASRDSSAIVSSTALYSFSLCDHRLLVICSRTALAFRLHLSMRDRAEWAWLKYQPGYYDRDEPGQIASRPGRPNPVLRESRKRWIENKVVGGVSYQKQGSEVRLGHGLSSWQGIGAAGYVAQPRPSPWPQCGAVISEGDASEPDF